MNLSLGSVPRRVRYGRGVPVRRFPFRCRGEVSSVEELLVEARLPVFQPKLGYGHGVARL